MSDRTYGSRVKAYGATVGEHEVVLEFDEKMIVLNEARLLVDGRVVDKSKIFYGEKELDTTLPDGTRIVVVVGSGLVGELTRAQLKQTDGSWLDLTEHAERP